MSTQNQKKRQFGFSLIELMISVTIGLAIVGGLASVFVRNSLARAEIERTNQQVENGRYAMQMLADDLRNAGYYAEFDPTTLSTPSTDPDPCATTVADLKAALPLHIQGSDNGASVPSCLSDVGDDTDILVVRRTSTCVAGASGCEDEVSGTPYFQASLCYPTSAATELASGNVNNFYALDTDTSTLTLHKRDCTTTANLRRYRTHIYFIAKNNEDGDEIPTLKRAELGSTGFTIVPLVEGVEDFQLEYGIDTDDNGTPDEYTADPSSYNSCAGADCVQNWRDVVAVKVNILARNTSSTAGHTDSKTYTLGLAADGTAYTVGPFEDGFKRHVYQALTRLNNPADRRGL